MQIRQTMTRPAPTIASDAYLEQAARRMVEDQLRCLVVVDSHGQAQGILTDRDLTAREPANPFQKHRRPRLAGAPLTQDLAQAYADLRTRRVARAMRPIPAFLTEEDAIERAMDLMIRHDVNHLPVLRNGRPVGVVSRLDLVQLLTTSLETPLTA